MFGTIPIGRSIFSGRFALLYSLFWFLLAIPGTALCNLIKKYLF
jgi:hypothetical protein